MIKYVKFDKFTQKLIFSYGNHRAHRKCGKSMHKVDTNAMKYSLGPIMHIGSIKSPNFPQKQ